MTLPRMEGLRYYVMNASPTSDSVVETFDFVADFSVAVESRLQVGVGTFDR